MYRSVRMFLSSLILFTVLLRSEPVEAAQVDTRNSEESSLGVSAAKLGQIENTFAASVPNYEQAILMASNAETNGEDSFGHSVSVDGDTLVAGAPYEDSNAVGVNGNQSDNSAADSGAAYVSTRSGISWIQQAYLKASNTEADDQFGYSVAVSGDTLVIGAPNEDSGATGVNGNGSDNSVSDSGAVYVFVRNGSIWSQQAYIKSSNSGYRDYFGTSVAILGDTIVVGARGEWSSADGVNGDQANDSSPQAGAVYVFTRSGTTWGQQAYIKASNSKSYNEFGYSVSISGDTVAVGAHWEYSNATGIDGDQTDSSAPRSGAVYIFTRTGTTWSQQAYIKASNTDAYDLFGESVSISGDTLAVGAPWEDSSSKGVNGNQADNSQEHSGAGYIFSRNGTTWTQQVYLKASNTAPNNNFGISVAISGDTMVVGAHFESSSGMGINGYQDDNDLVTRLWSGASYIFTRNGTTWSQSAYVKASNSDFQIKFGWAVSISGETLAVGALLGFSSHPGAVYVFAYAPPPIFQDVSFTYWSRDYIERLYNAGITGGCTTTPLNYCPDSTVTRAQMAVFLLKGIHGSSYTPPAVGVNTGFADVSTSYWAAAWIKQLAAEGITGGCGSGNYCPDTTVTRAQMAVFLLKAKHSSVYTPPNATGVFTDVPVGYWADKWIEQLASEGITGGCGTSIYCPDADVTRAQMAVFLVKAFNLP